MLRGVAVLLGMMGILSASATETAPSVKPTLREFLGLCTHTVQFKPDLYKPICRLARDYHPVEWDLGADTDHKTEFPFARNRVDWGAGVYEKWKAAGFETDCSLMFESIPQAKWKDVSRDAETYGKAFASFFGPSGATKLVASAEVGNEPGKWDDPSYRKMFEAMARGLRAGDPKLTILTCNVTAGKSHDYAKSVECFKGFESLYDAINLHVYAMIEGWPTWKRSFPEDPKITYLKEVRDVIAWRDKNAPGKPLWITEFGWDCSTKQPDPKTEFAKWQGVTDTQQARWLVRSILVFMSMDVARAYIYWFNDEDTPSLHAAAGLTRHWKPKESYWAVSHLYKTLGDYRFSRAIQSEAGAAYVYEFTNATDPKKSIIAAWSPTGSERSADITIDLGGRTLVKAERMPIKEGDVPAEIINVKGGGALAHIDEAPLYLFLNQK